MSASPVFRASIVGTVTLASGATRKANKLMLVNGRTLVVYWAAAPWCGPERSVSFRQATAKQAATFTPSWKDIP